MNKCVSSLAAGALCAIACPPLAFGQGVPSAGQEAPRNAEEPRAPGSTGAAQSSSGGRIPADHGPEFPVHPWRLPAIDVAGEAKPELAEEDRIGDYEQPRWTSARRFPTTRMYVMPAGKVEAEYWLRYTAPIKSFTAEREARNYYEMGFGLGHRLQLDIYFVTQQDGTGKDSTIALKREQLEVRYALADWGTLWGNPTLYLEWQRRNGENDWIEPKILLAGGIAPGWHAGFNLVLEAEVAGALEREWDLTAGLSRTVIDEKFHVGVEGYVEVHDFKGARLKFGDTERLFLGGPSFLWHPVAPMHMLISPLFGVGSPGGEPNKTMVRLWFVTGWTF